MSDKRPTRLTRMPKQRPRTGSLATKPVWGDEKFHSNMARKASFNLDLQRRNTLLGSNNKSCSTNVSTNGRTSHIGRNTTLLPMNEVAVTQDASTKTSGGEYSNGQIKGHIARRRKTITKKKSIKKFTRTMGRKTKLFRTAKKNKEVNKDQIVRNARSDPEAERKKSYMPGVNTKRTARGSIANSKIFEGKIVAELEVGGVKPIEAFREEYDVRDSILGEGSFAKVILARKKEDHNALVAAKTTKPFTEGEDEVERLETFKQFVNEVNILHHLEQFKHPHIIKIIDIYHSQESEQLAQMLFTTEFIPGISLQEIVKFEDYKFFSETKIKLIFLQLTSALEFCRSQGVVHRDLKPENVMVNITDVAKETVAQDGYTIITTKTQKIEVKLIDFNLALKSSEFEVGLETIEGSCGTFHFMSPEMHMGRRYSYKADVWSLGVMLYYCLSQGYLPFQSKDNLVSEMKKKIVDCDWKFSPAEKWDVVSHDAKALVVKLLVLQMSKRLSYSAIMDHKFLRLPSSRNTSVDI